MTKIVWRKEAKTAKFGSLANGTWFTYNNDVCLKLDYGSYEGLPYNAFVFSESLPSRAKQISDETEVGLCKVTLIVEVEHV